MQSTDPLSRTPSDPLLSTVWWLITVFMVACLVAMIAGLLWYPALLVTERPAPSLSGWVGLLGLLIAGGMALTFSFLRNLRQIIDSVARGRPFDPINADRLRRMAWLSIAIQIVLVPMTRLIIWFDALPYKPNVFFHSDGVSIGAIVLTLVLFVLARVFRSGAEMQEDLEGTV